MSDSDPKIWSKLPFEVLLNILDCLPKRDAINWTLVTREIYPYVRPKFWNTLEIKAFEVEECRHARKQNPKGDQEGTTRNIVDFLTHKAHSRDIDTVLEGPQTLKTTRIIEHPNVGPTEPSNVGPTEPGPIMPSGIVGRLPSSMVRHLILSDRSEPNLGPNVLSHIVPRSTDILSELFLSLSGLSGISYDGLLRMAIFANIINIKNLTSLSLRLSLEEAKLPESMEPVGIPWNTSELDLGTLATLPHLRSLRLGHLRNGEVQGLAHSVWSLKLVTLQISTSTWLTLDRDRPGAKLSSQSASPLSTFLSALAKLQSLGGSQQRGFPATLRYLSLCDRYYPKTPSLHQYLASLIKHCGMLDTIDLEMIVNWIDTKKEDVGSLKIPSRDLTISLQSWSQLSDKGGRIPVLAVPQRTIEDLDDFAAFRFSKGDCGFISDLGRLISRLPKGTLTFISDIGRVLDEVVTHEEVVTHVNGQCSSTRHRPWRYVRTMRIKKEPHGHCKGGIGETVEVSWAQGSRCDIAHSSTSWIIRGCVGRLPGSLRFVN